MSKNHEQKQVLSKDPWKKSKFQWRVMTRSWKNDESWQFFKKYIQRITQNKLILLNIIYEKNANGIKESWKTQKLSQTIADKCNFLPPPFFFNYCKKKWNSIKKIVKKCTFYWKIMKKHILSNDWGGKMWICQRIAEKKHISTKNCKFCQKFAQRPQKKL